MKRIHLIIGSIVIVVFLLTGQYMEFHQPKIVLDNGMRMMYRSRHVYILFAGLINLSAGVYFSYRRQLWRKVLQQAGSSLMIVAPFVLTGAFFYEPMLKGLQNPLTIPAVVGIFIGVICHLVSGIGIKPESGHHPAANSKK